MQSAVSFVRGWFQTLCGKTTPSPIETPSKAQFNPDASTAMNAGDVFEQQCSDFTVSAASAGETKIIASAEMEENPVYEHMVEVSDTVMENMEMNADNGQDVVRGAGGETQEMRVDGGVDRNQASEMGDTPIAADTEHNGVEEIVDTAPFDEVMSEGGRDDDSLGGGGDDDVDMEGFFEEDEMGFQDDTTDMDWRCRTRSRPHRNGLFQVEDFADGRIRCRISYPRNSTSNFRSSTPVPHPCSRLSGNGQTP